MLGVIDAQHAITPRRESRHHFQQRVEQLFRTVRLEAPGTEPRRVDPCQPIAQLSNRFA